MSNRPRGLQQMRQELEARYANGEVPPAEDVTGAPVALPVQEAPAQTAVTEPVTAEPAAEPAADPAAEPGVDWEHKYRSVEGRINALTRKVADLEAENAELKTAAAEADQAANDFAGHIADLEIEIRELKGSASTASQTPRGKRITEEEEKAWGDDLVDVMRRAAQEENDALREQIETLKKDLDEVKPVVKQSKAEKEAQAKADAEAAKYRGFLAEVSTLLGDPGEVNQTLARVNGDTGFHKWLKVQDKITGQTRQAMLLEREKALDAAGIARIFQAYMDEEASKPAPSATPDPTPAKPAQGKVSLESMAAPGGAKVASAAPRADSNDATRKVPESEIHAFIASLTNGGFRGTAQERKTKLDFYDRANKEGRVVPGH